MHSSETRHWNKLPVPLKWLCGLDELPAENALANAFGDRYLCRNNPIFRGVRDAALGFGYRFSAEDTPLWRDYQACPLTTLHRILAEKTIPYFDTGTTVSRLLKMNPGVAVSPGLLISSVKHNHAFHESAHGVAHSVMERFAADLRSLAPDEKDRFVLESILAESFANTVERLGSSVGSRVGSSVGSSVEAKPVSDGLFYALNSYFAPSRTRAEALNSAAAASGASMAFAVLFLASFEANLTTEPASEAAYDRISSACGVSFRNVIDAGFDLNGKFREDTTPMYFDLIGHQKQYFALVNAVWLDTPEHARFARDLASVLFETITS